MAAIIRSVPKVIGKQVVVGVKQGMKQVVKPATGYEVVDMNSIEFLASGRGGGKPMNPAVAKLIEKAFSLSIGQALKVPVTLRTQKQITNATTGKSSEIHSYQGAQSLSKKAGHTLETENPYRFRTRRDVNNNLWLFRVEPLITTEVTVEEEE